MHFFGKKRALSLAAVLMAMALLTACNTPAEGTPVPSGAATPQVINTQSPVQAATQEPDPLPAAADYINADGTIAFPAGVELQSEDYGYFVPSTDDFALVQRQMSYTVLTLLCYDADGMLVSGVERWWFKDGWPEGSSGFNNYFGLGSDDEIIEMRDSNLMYVIAGSEMIDSYNRNNYQTPKEQAVFQSQSGSPDVEYWFSRPLIEQGGATQAPFAPSSAQISIDDPRVPDVLKKTVGTLAAVLYDDGSMSSVNCDYFIKLEFTGVTQGEYDELIDHYKSHANESEYSLEFDWGTITTGGFNNGAVTVVAYFQQ